MDRVCGDGCTALPQGLTPLNQPLHPGETAFESQHRVKTSDRGIIEKRENAWRVPTMDKSEI